MEKNQKTLIGILIVGVAVLLVATLFQHQLFDPFGEPPTVAGGNCSKEYRFTTSTKFESSNDFLEFLKSKQSNDKLYNFEPTENKLVPALTNNDNATNLDDFEGKITVENSKGIFTNEKIYSVWLGNGDFNENYPWRIKIKASSGGQISWNHCAGI